MDRFEVDERAEIPLVIEPLISRELLSNYLVGDAPAFLREVCSQAVKLRASDIYFKVGAPPCFALNSRVAKLQFDALEQGSIIRILATIAGDQKSKHFLDNHPELDISYEIPLLSRFRVNFYKERGNLAFVMRIVPLEIPTLDSLGLPPILGKMAFRQQGMILVTGPTGSGKTTTIAAMINHINENRCRNIVTIEDPIEFSHPDKLSIISQREVGFGLDTESFQTALREVLRQAPNVILIGEMRDVETMNVAMQAAETGHLVFSTVHTNSAAETIERIVNMYPPEDKAQICLRLSGTFLGICSQKLVPTKDGTGRVCAAEILVNTPTVAKLIEEQKMHDVYSHMKDDTYWQMQTMNQSLIDHFINNRISEENALTYSTNRGEMTKEIHNAKRDQMA